MKSLYNRFKTKLAGLAAAGAAVLGMTVMSPSTSHAVAALPAGAAAAITEIGETATLFETAFWPVILIVSVALICIKLYKRFSGKI